MRLGFGLGLQYSKLSGGGGNTDAFIIEVKTDNAGTSNNNQFEFTGAVGNYDVIAKQNDIVVATFDNLSGAETITFANGAGTYILEVKAKEVDGFTGMRFNNSGDKEKITKNLQWGIFNDTRQQLFYGCLNLTEIGSDVNWLNSITNGDIMFFNCSITSLPSEMTLANLTNGDRMFQDCNLTSLPSEMTLANLTNGDRMFFNCNLTSLSSEMTLANLTNGPLMFFNCNLTSLPSEMTLANLTNGDRMFTNCDLTSLPSEMTLANLTNGPLMFQNCSITSLPSEMTLANLTNGPLMFQNCNLTSLPSEMTLANLTNGDRMFFHCNLTSLPSEMTLANLTNGDRMFENNTIITSRYSTLLVDMENFNSNTNVSFHGGNSKYNAAGETARNLLIANQNWTFTDAGPA